MRRLFLCSILCLLAAGCTVGIARREVLTPDAIGTPVPSPAPSATWTPAIAPTQPQPSPTETPLPTFTLMPTPVLEPPTDTPIPSPTETPEPCSFEIGPVFSARLDAHPDALQALGCPTAEQQQQWTAEQGFQHGRMFWKQDTREVYIVYYDSGVFQVGADPYVEGDPDDACPEVGDAPEGLYKPVRGFNRQWCNVPGVREGLGWALEQEVGYDGVWQRFRNGLVAQSRADHLFVLYDEGTWEYIE